MALFVWDDAKFSVGFKVQDDQHKKLVAILNELHDAMAMKREQAVLGRLFSDLVQYTAYHFSTEERYMKEHAYSGFPIHKAEHDALVKKALDLQKKFQEGATGLSLETSEFLKAWLAHHICEVDKKLGAFLTSKVAGKSAVPC